MFTIWFDDILPDAQNRKASTYPRLPEEHVAFNLAGQAVVSRLVNVSVERVSAFLSTFRGSIEHPRYLDGPLATILQTEREWREATPNRVFDGFPLHAREQVFDAHVTILLAGAAAERHFCNGLLRFHTSADDRKISRLVRIGSCDRRALKRKATSLVGENRAAILAVARRLVSLTTISGEHLDRIIRPLVVPAPKMQVL